MRWRWHLLCDGAPQSEENWLKARASNEGKGAKITNEDGFIFKSVALYTRSSSAFLSQVNVTWRTIDDVTSSATLVNLVTEPGPK